MRVEPGPPQADSPNLKNLERNIVVQCLGGMRRLDFLDFRIKRFKESYRARDVVADQQAFFVVQDWVVVR